MADLTSPAPGTEPSLAALASSGRKVSKASLVDTALAMKDVILPTLAKGPLIRRRGVVTMAERQRLDDKAVRRMQALRRKYGAGPLVLSIPFRPQALLLSRQDVHMVLAHSPMPFTAATLEKRAALGHFEPGNVLASKGIDRERRRQLNEQALETGCQRHSMGTHFATAITEEMQLVCQEALSKGRLDWDAFFVGWMRMVRRIVLGDAAREDSALTDLLEGLRYRANLAFLRPKARHRRRQLLDRLEHYVNDAAPESLAGKMARHCRDANQLPQHQLPQYLFAFDPGAMASFRTLALLTTHSAAQKRIAADLAETASETVPHLPLLRAAYLEALRLWPTTPAILRETLEPVNWSGSRLKQGTHVIIFTPFFHRDDETLADAHTFNPDRWLGKVVRPDEGLVPFSYGPVQCPAAHFVPMVASLAMRHLLTRLTLELTEPERLDPTRLPGTLDNFTLSFLAEAPRSNRSP